jgi:hypothetical protein
MWIISEQRVIQKQSSRCRELFGNRGGVSLAGNQEEGSGTGVLFECGQPGTASSPPRIDFHFTQPQAGLQLEA